MDVTVNGQSYSISENKTLAALLEEMQLAHRHVAVAVNQEIVPRSELNATQLKSGDSIELVHAVGGG